MKSRPRHANIEAVIAHIKKAGVTSREQLVRECSVPRKLKTFKGAEDKEGVALDWLRSLDATDWIRVTGLRAFDKKD